MRKKILIVMLLIFTSLLGIWGVQPFAWAQNDSTPQYTYGWRARIFQPPQDFHITNSLPATELGNFVATKSKYQLGEYMGILKGAPQLNSVLWVGEAFLKAEETGFYVFSVINTHSYLNTQAGYDSIAKAIYIEGVTVATSAGDRLLHDTLMGAAELEPGLYKIEFRIAGISGKAERFSDSQTLDLRVKRPSDDRGLPISQVLLLPVPGAGDK